MATALDFVRSGVGTPAKVKKMVEKLVRYCQETKRDGRLLADEPDVRRRLAQLSVEAEVLRILCYRITWLQTKGKVPNYEASVSKVFGAGLLGRLTDAAMHILGPFSQIDRGSKWAALRGEALRLFLTSPSMGIGGGTNEIQKSIIATRGLGLPR